MSRLRLLDVGCGGGVLGEEFAQLGCQVTGIYGLQESPLTKLMPPDTHVWEMFITPEEMIAALEENGMQIVEMKGGKIPKNPLATPWDVRQQKMGKISFAELGRRLQLKLDEDLSLNLLGYAHTTK